MSIKLLERRDNGWTPVEFKLPVSSAPVLVFYQSVYGMKHENWHIVIGSYSRSDDRWFSSSFADEDVPTVTHWMELPKHPEQPRIVSMKEIMKRKRDKRWN